MLCKNCKDNKTYEFIEEFDDNTKCIYDMLTQYKVDHGIITDEKIVKKFKKSLTNK